MFTEILKYSRELEFKSGDNVLCNTYRKYNPENEDLELLVKAAKVFHDPDLRSDWNGVYGRVEDLITMRPRDLYISSEAYYSVFLHELVHWSGHSTRLNRLTPEDCWARSLSHIREELIAQLVAIEMMKDFGYKCPDGSYRYIAWLLDDADCLVNFTHETYEQVVTQSYRAYNYLMHLYRKLYFTYEP